MSCPLCAGAAPSTEFRDFLDVKCATCGDYLVTRAALGTLNGEPRVKAELARQARWIARSGGRAFIGLDTVTAARERIESEERPR